MMFATVLVALMAFAVQSCGSDDNNSPAASMYRLNTSFSLQTKGDFTDEAISTLQEGINKEERGEYLTDNMAATAGEKVVGTSKLFVQTIMNNVGSPNGKFTITVVVTKVSTNAEIAKWEIVYENGTVSTNQILKPGY